MCPGGVSVAVGGKELCEIWKGCSIEELVLSQLLLSLAPLELRHYCPSECPQSEKPNKIISEH